MKECCENQITPHCPTCGGPIKGYPLIEIKAYFEQRYASAESRLTARQNAPLTDGATKAVKEEHAEGVRKAADVVGKWSRWIGIIENAMERWDGEHGEIEQV